jgi:hypothetical protein
MKDYGFKYPLILCIPEDLFQDEICYTLQYNDIPYRKWDQAKSLNVLKQIQAIQSTIGIDYDKICFILDLNLIIDENFDYIFSSTLSEENREKFIKKYKDKIFLFDF